MNDKLAAFIEFDPETKLYVGVITALPGAHTQAATLDELQQNLIEVAHLCLEEHQNEAPALPGFTDMQPVETTKPPLCHAERSEASTR